MRLLAISIDLFLAISIPAPNLLCNLLPIVFWGTALICTLLLNNHKFIPSLGENKQTNWKIFQIPEADFQGLACLCPNPPFQLILFSFHSPSLPALYLHWGQFLGLPFSITSTHPYPCHLGLSLNPQKAIPNFLPWKTYTFLSARLTLHCFFFWAFAAFHCVCGYVCSLAAQP